ncbi:hypothetical protein BDM02DRAFT_3120773 [Thelephora ganbajun]|uniref:Uncharacterized protein n=1 Tax=Thelephora ganbajun TaxID=370292 RepID=A0ACB6Z5U9_THEGA|nr:hypothetical protein BDM02DRAFT_3120773 [Thelephora ganbajun]
MLFRSLIRSSRAIKPAFVQPVTPLRARFIASSSNSSSPSTTAKVKVKVVGGEAPLFKPPSDQNKLSARDLTEGTYEKVLETSSEPITTYSGTRSYVVNEPDPADSKYEIPTGAYHSTAPYERSEEVKYEEFGGERGLREGKLMDKEGTKEGVDWVLESESSAGKA